MSEVTNLATRIALLQTQLSRNLAELAVAQRTAANSLVTGRLQDVIAQQEQELAQLQTQLAQAQQRAALGTASAGNLARDDQQATVPGSRSQAPQPVPEVLTPDGRIQPQPDTTTATTATPPVTENSVDSGTNAPVRPITQTQATPAYGPGLLRDPGDADAQEGGFYGGGQAPIAATQAGFGAGGEEAAPRNATRVEIDNIFTETQITPQPNVLDQYASYTYAVSVYLAPVEQYKTMLETKQRTLAGNQLLFQSGGAPTGGRNQFFSLDYYIDKLEIKSFIVGKGTGLTHNAKEINMTVVEPNGITLIDNLTRAVQAIMPDGEKKKSVTSAIYLMVIRFYGYDAQGNLVRGGVARPDGTTDPNAFIEKWYPFIIKDIKFRVANKTVEYDISAAAPQFQIAAGQARGTIPFNIELSGQTIKDLLSGPLQYSTNQASVSVGGNNAVVPTETYEDFRSAAPAKADAAPTTKATVRQGLMAALNQQQRDLEASRPGYVADEYSIEFVGAGNGPTAIEQARLRPPGGLDKKGTSNATPGTPADSKLPNKQSMDPNSRTQSATAGMQIVQFLDQVLRNSTYLKDQQLVIIDPATQEEKFNGTPAQNVAWFKISLEAIPKEKFDTVRNQYAYKIKYTISPYKIVDLQSKYFPTPRFTGVQKEYKYWFTGENTSVLNYEENINGLYYLTLSGAGVNLAGTYLNQDGEKINYNFQTASTESSQGADGKVNEPVANASEYLFQPGSLKEANVTIVGDPAWLQQGEGSLGQLKRNWNFGSFFPDGTLNFDGGQILFRIAFNAPADYDSDYGLVRPGLATSQAPGPAQGAPNGPAQINRVYIAHTVTSSFNRGKFTQQLVGALKLDLSTNDNTAARVARIGEQQQAIAGMSGTRALASSSVGLTLASTLGTTLNGVAATSYVPPVIPSTFGQGLRVPTSLVNNVGTNVLGGQSTRPSSIPGLPTSFGLPIGALNNTAPSRLPGAQTNFAQTISDAVDGTQRTIRGVVDSVSNGVTQTVAGSDDSGTGLISSPVAETLYQSPETSDLISEPVAEFNANNDFFG
jgi:hypothetical protein